MSASHYQVLDVSQNATAEDIQSAYRALARRYHPDRNASPEAAARMTVINQAWEVLRDPVRRREYDVRLSRPVSNGEIGAATLLAARELVLRSGWRVVEDNGRNLLLENARQRLRLVFLDCADNAGVARLSRQFPEFCVVLAASFLEPLAAGSAVTGIDLTRSVRYGAPLPEGPCRSLLAPFL